MMPRIVMTKREKALAAWSAAFVTLAIYTAYVAYPLGVRCLDLRESLDGVRTRYEEATKPKQTAVRILEDIRAFKALGIRAGASGRRPDPVSAAERVIALAKSAGCSVESIKPGEVRESAGLLSVPVSFRLRGSMKGLMLFLGHLDEEAPPIAVTGMKLSGEGEDGLISLTGGLDCYTGEGSSKDGK